VYRSLEGVTLPEGRHVQIVRGVFGKLKGHRDHDPIYRVMPRLKELIGESVFAYAEPERDPTKHPNIEGYRNYVGKAQIGAKEYYVPFTIQEARVSRHQFHNAALSDVQLTEATVGAAHTDISTSGKPQSSSLDSRLVRDHGGFFELSIGTDLPC